MSAPRVTVRRVYSREPVSGKAVLVDRVWPRGVSRSELEGVEWLPAVGPSGDLRKWFGHRPERWEEFRRRYRAELMEGEGAAAFERLEALAREGPLTLLFGARDEERNQAVVVRELLLERLRT